MSDFDLQSLLICPDRGLAEDFLRTVPVLRAFQVIADLKSYPAEQALEVRLRQLDPDVFLLDVATDLEVAGTLIEQILQKRPGAQIVGLHSCNDKDAVVSTLRRGASEFLHSPFELRAQQEAVSRLRRLRRPLPTLQEREPGRLICISNAKPGSGASTIAFEVATVLEQQTGGRVLLVDGDAAGGTLAWQESDDDSPSLDSLLRGGSNLSWHRQTLKIGGIEVLPAPRDPLKDCADPSRFAEVIEPARRIYDWIVLDMPAIYDRLSLMSVPAADVFLLVSTGELASLHLTRRALGLLENLGFGKNAVRIVVNRMAKREGLGAADLRKVFSTAVEAALPIDETVLHSKVGSPNHRGPLGSNSEFGRAVHVLATRLQTAARADRGSPSGAGTQDTLTAPIKRH